MMDKMYKEFAYLIILPEYHNINPTDFYKIDLQDERKIKSDEEIFNSILE